MNYRPSNTYRVVRPEGYFAKRPGTVVTIKDCPNGYPLQAGLESGDNVTVVAFDCGYYVVKKSGRTFEIFSANIV